jgi:uncharacterized membrane protein YccC
MQGNVELDLFVSVVGGVVLAAISVTGWLTRRQDLLDRRMGASLEQLNAKLATLAQQTAARHDTGLADLWQALEDHRVESRRQAAEAERRSGAFREDTLRQLGGIAATLARLEARLPQPHATQPGD